MSEPFTKQERQELRRLLGPQWRNRLADPRERLPEGYRHLHEFPFGIPAWNSTIRRARAKVAPCAECAKAEENLQHEEPFTLKTALRVFGVNVDTASEQPTSS